MSYDRAIEHVCPHEVREEALYIEPDGKTIKPLRPIASSESVVVRVNSAATVPSTGLYAPGRCVGTRRGPFTIVRGVNDVLIVQVGAGAPVTIQVPPAVGITASLLAAQLNVVPGISFQAVNNRIGLRTVLDGWGATASLRPGSTLASTLGLPISRVWRGRTIYPGWFLVSAPRTLSDRPARWIIFDEPLKGSLDFVEIDYSTVQQECRRCGGLGIEHDWRYADDGNVITLRNEALLQQEVLKMIYTVQGTNVFHPWYGTSLVEAIGSKILDGALVQTTISADVQQGFQRWQSIKRQQEDGVGQSVTDREFPFRLVSVSVKQSTRDPSVMFVGMTVQNRSAEEFDLARGIRVPQPDDLLGSTQTQGILRQIQNNLVLAE